MKQRSINTSIWVDGWFQDLEPKRKLLFMFLLTNPETNLAGIYEITIKTIEFHTSLSIKEITDFLKEFQDSKKVFRTRNYVIMVNHLKHQKLNTNMKTSLFGILNSLPEYVKKSEGYIEYQKVMKSYSNVELV